MTQVRVVAITKPVGSLRDMDPGEFIAYAARVSNPANQMNMETSPRLINYLIKKKHWSPFEMASATLEIITTRDIGRQILRHRSFSFQEFSQRYAAVAQFVIREARLQDSNNRQNSIDTEDELLQEWWESTQQFTIQSAQQKYEEALSRGIAKEVARAILPEGNTVTTMYMAGTIRSWIHYIAIRAAIETQKEHREIAQMCKSVLVEYYEFMSTIDFDTLGNEILNKPK